HPRDHEARHVQRGPQRCEGTELIGLEPVEQVMSANDDQRESSDHRPRQMQREGKDNHRPSERPEHERESWDQPEPKLKTDRADGEVEENEPETACREKPTRFARRASSLEVEPKAQAGEKTESRRAEVSHPPRRKQGGR